MASDSDALQAFLAAQRADFRASVPGRLAQCEAAWHAALPGPGSRDAVRALERCAHTLAGSAPVFGWRELGASARTLEEALEPWLEEGASWDDAARGAAEPLVRDLLQHLRATGEDLTER